LALKTFKVMGGLHKMSSRVP